VNAVVLDHTAVIAFASGNRRISRMITQAHSNVNRLVYVPTLCLIAAEVEAAGITDHLGALPAVHVIDLGFAEAEGVATVIADGHPWQCAHAVASARPTLEWPTGRPLVTRKPKQYVGMKLHVIAVR
jgi:hypothetical protein